MLVLLFTARTHLRLRGDWRFSYELTMAISVSEHYHYAAASQHQGLANHS